MTIYELQNILYSGNQGLLVKRLAQRRLEQPALDLMDKGQHQFFCGFMLQQSIAVAVVPSGMLKGQSCKLVNDASC